MFIGIDDIAFYTSKYYLDLRELAKNRGIEDEKLLIGIGQEKMSIALEDEDIVTLAANAAEKILKNCDISKIDSLLLATETGIDQSKSAGIFIHDLLKLPSNCKTVEFKQACYSATAALQHACAIVARNPQKTVLVIAADIAKYDLNTPGEATQGCGAVAMIIKKNPQILTIEEETGVFCGNFQDFWRPNYRSTPIVDGKYSTQIYIKSAKNAWDDLVKKTAVSFDDLEHICYHLPFTMLGVKTHQKLAKLSQSKKNEEDLSIQISSSLKYSRVVGNCYTASLYLSFVSLLDNAEKNLANKKIGFFSFGSGCVGEFFIGRLMPDYKQNLQKNEISQYLENRKAITFMDYEKNHNLELPIDGSSVKTEEFLGGKFRFSGITNHHRNYETRRIL